MFGATPFLEYVGQDGVRQYDRSLPIKTHLPLPFLRLDPLAKYIYVCRNPKDTLVSYFFHCKSEKGCPEYAAMTFDEFFRSFVQGTTDWNDYFDHVTGFYERRKDPNLLFLTYEEMKADLESAIRTISRFMSEDCGRKLDQDPALLKRIVEEASFEKMKNNINNSVQAMMDGKVEVPGKMRHLINELARIPSLQGFADLTFARKGVVGDHVNHLSADQEAELSELARKRLAKCPDLLHLWAKHL